MADPVTIWCSNRFSLCFRRRLLLVDLNNRGCYFADKKLIITSRRHVIYSSDVIFCIVTYDVVHSTCFYM